MSSSEVSERELPLIQRGIIDNCFEEGQYEYGIDVLDKLRGQGYKPTPLHIRQLLYIALYPPPPPKPMDRADAPPSPQKVQFQRQKEDLWPKPTSRPRAIALLEAFVGSNSPESLMRGLPFYSDTNNEGLQDVDPLPKQRTIDHHLEDNSPLKGELLSIESLKDCWGLLKGGLVKRKQLDRNDLDDMATKHNTDQNTIVGPYAWPVLEWLIQVFEEDESRAVKSGNTPHSVLLLRQIPQPRSKKGPSWNVETPLQVAFTCLSPMLLDLSQKSTSSHTCCDLGMRLISLLVNLTTERPPLLSPQHLLRSLTLRLLDLPLFYLQIFLSGIPPNQTLFKISVLVNYISPGSHANGDHMRKTGTTTNPAPRAKPKCTGKGATDVVPSNTASAEGKDKDPYPIASRDTLLKLLSSPLPDISTHGSSGSSSSPSLSAAAKVALAKFHLVSALCSLYLSHHLPGFRAIVREGKLRGMVVDDEVQSDMQKIKGYLSSTLEIVKVWEVS